MLSQGVVYCVHLLLLSEKMGGKIPDPQQPGGSALSADLHGNHGAAGAPPITPHVACPGSEAGSPAQPSCLGSQPRPLHLYLVPLVGHRSCAFTDGASLPRSMAFPHREEQALSPPVPLPEWESRCPPALAHPGPALSVQQESPPYLGTWGDPCALPFLFYLQSGGTLVYRLSLGWKPLSFHQQDMEVVQDQENAVSGTDSGRLSACAARSLRVPVLMCGCEKLPGQGWLTVQGV